MNLSWMFGSSLAARHLLYAYLSVWLIQGGYAGWIGWQWLRTKKTAQPPVPADTVTREDA
jgi:hypothetical protein